jgi:hypothetical protein
LIIMAAGLATPAAARGVDRAVGLNGAPTSWAKMSRHRTSTRRGRMRRHGAGTASSSAPNGAGTGMGPTGQPSGVK